MERVSNAERMRNANVENCLLSVAFCLPFKPLIDGKCCVSPCGALTLIHSIIVVAGRKQCWVWSFSLLLSFALQGSP